jgi:hydroxyacylglutathione hydrolase
VVVDAGAKVNAKRLIKALHGHAVGAHALTHAHPDHAGGTRRLVDAYDVPVWVGSGDRDTVQSGHPPAPQTWAEPAVARLGGFEGVGVARSLREGDDLGHGFTVLETPGHSDGHVAFWRERDRTLVLGDVFFNMHALTTVPGLHEPPRILTRDPRRNRESARRLAALEPELALFGHGPPLRDPTALTAFVAGFEA